jgi:pimeloyl-ACP methyl ester carboxylesterase
MNRRASATDKWVTVDGLRLHYKDWGNESAQPVLCLHGFTSNANSWDLFAAAMCKEYHVLALDQLGHGDSDWLEDIRDYANRHVPAISEFVDLLGLERLILIGLSMGGRNAWTYTLKHPEKVDKLIIVDVSPEVPQPSEDGPFGRKWLETILKYDEFDSPRHALDVFRSIYALVGDEERLTEQIERNMKQLPNGRLTWKYDRRLLKTMGNRYFELVQMPSQTWEELRKIQCPTLVIRGGISQTLSPELAKRMCDTIPNCKFAEVANAAHGVTADNPRGFKDAVRTFLRH